MKSKADLLKAFGVSGATLNNWIRAGLIPPPMPNGKYTQEHFEAIKEELNQHETKLKSRANRSRNFVKRIPSEMLLEKGSLKILQHIIRIHESIDGSLEDTLIALSLRFLELGNLISISNHTTLFLQKSTASFQAFLNDWISKNNVEKIWKIYTPIKDVSLPIQEVDFLGTLYQSLRSVSEKSHLGAYFTPASLLQEIKILKNDRVCDPCCGTGRILIQVLSKDHNPDHVYASDIDVVALNICRINLALFFESTAASPHFELNDFIFPENEHLLEINQMDVIVTNPPWGAKMNSIQKKILLQRYPALNTTETFCIALFRAAMMLAEKGHLHFVLPESFLSVAAHAGIRKFILTEGQGVHIRHFGNVFKGVLSKVIRLDVFKTGLKKELYFIDGPIKIKIPESLLSEKHARFPFLKNEIEARLLEKIYGSNYTTLKGSCTFGLGIVTGDNKKHLLNAKSTQSEPIFSGKEIFPFRLDSANRQIIFRPDVYQQVAPTTLYRTEKICYRFISNRIIMALDKSGSLLLNSANFFIPDKRFDQEILVLLFNASLTTFFYQRLYNSTKVLRSHIENFPIPELNNADILCLKRLYDKAVLGIDIRTELDAEVAKLFSLNAEETLYICQHIKTPITHHSASPC